MRVLFRRVHVFRLQEHFNDIRDDDEEHEVCKLFRFRHAVRHETRPRP